MYLFFMISGVIFTILCSIIICQTYNVFSINKITNFIYPTEQTIFNKISVSLMPILIWSFIEIIVLGLNSYFILGLILNIFLNCAISYIIIYGYYLISEKGENIVKIISIIIANIFSYSINYVCLLIGKETDIINSIIGVLCITIFYIIIKIFPPKSNFFRSK